MAGNRIGRINEEIRKELSALLRTVKDPRVSEGMLTITRVDTTSDLRYARVYISALNCTDEKGLMKGLKSAVSCMVRRALIPDPPAARCPRWRGWRASHGSEDPECARRGRWNRP